MQPDLLDIGSSQSRTSPPDLTPATDWGLQLTVTRHSLGWLFAANLVGVWLAANLVWPNLAKSTGALTYGRWMPLHTEWELYGWSALPLVGLLYRWLPAPDRRHAQFERFGIFLWSAVLAASGISWLAGNNSGKLFLSTTGIVRLGLPLTLALLWACLGANLWHQRARLSSSGSIARSVLLAALLPVPALLWRAGDSRVYPAFNPDSGGATGPSLLGSTLVILAIVGLLPWALQLPVRKQRWPLWAFGGYFLLSVAIFAAGSHGNVSHHHPGAIAGLATLLAWSVLLDSYLASFGWTTAPLWRRALIVWWTLLAATGFVIFLPGLSERLKFTNALVAHAHLAMAGFSTALCFVVLQANVRGGLRAALEDKHSFGIWQAGTVVYVVAMALLGWRESVVPGVLFQSDQTAHLLYSLRLLSGVVMAAISLRWFSQSLKRQGVAHEG